MFPLLKKIINKIPWRFQPYFGYRPKSEVSIVDFFKNETFPSLKKEFYKKIFDKEVISHIEPKCYNEIIHENYNNQKPKALDDCFVFGLKNSSYIQHSWIPSYITSNNLLLSEASYDPKKGRYVKPIFSLKDVGEPIRLNGKSLVLCEIGCHNGYYHWLAQLIPKLLILEKYGLSILDFDHIIVNGPSMKFKESTLNELNIPKEKIIYTEAEQLYKFEFMVGVSGIVYHKEGIDFIRKNFLRKGVISAPRKIYLSRAKSNHRKIVEEDKLIEMLRLNGFETICFEDYSVKEQAEIMSSAKVIVTAHGAGLTNLIFASPKVKVFEILEDNFVNTNFWLWSGIMNLDYHCYVGKAIKNKSFGKNESPSRPGFDDILLGDHFYKVFGEFINYL